MTMHTFLAAVRLDDGTQLKFHVEDVPDDITAVRKIIEDELAQAGRPARCIVIRTDAATQPRSAGVAA